MHQAHLHWNTSDEAKKLWYWAADLDTEPPEGVDPEQHRKELKAALPKVPEEDRLYIHLGEMVRVRLDEEIFQESGPKKAPKVVLPGVATENNEQQEPEIPPWQLIVCRSSASILTWSTSSCTFYETQCSMDEQGLGVIEWVSL